MREAAGKRSPAGKRHGNKRLSGMSVEATGSVGRMHGKNYLADQHARLTKRRGMRPAQVAVAPSMLVSAYYMLKRDEPHRDLGPDWLAHRHDEAHARRRSRNSDDSATTSSSNPPSEARLRPSRDYVPTR